MRKFFVTLTSALALAFVLACVPDAEADGPPNVTGVWKGVCTVTGSNRKPYEFEVTLEIVRQMAKEFVGVRRWTRPGTGESVVEKVSGAVGADEKIYMVGGGGEMAVGTVSGGRMDMSFWDSGKSGRVAHYELKRQQAELRETSSMGKKFQGIPGSFGLRRQETLKSFLDLQTFWVRFAAHGRMRLFKKIRAHFRTLGGGVRGRGRCSEAPGTP